MSRRNTLARRQSALRLRPSSPRDAAAPVADLDLDRRAITVRGRKGAKDRVTILPELLSPLYLHLETVRRRHQKELSQRYGTVELPFALALKYRSAATSWAWQYLSPPSDGR
jgi:hypothetical protein